MLKIIVLCVLMPECFSQGENQNDGYSRLAFGSYQRQHRKKYQNERESEQRYQIFKNNGALILAHNEKYQRGEVSWAMDKGPFTDMTEEEFLNRFRSIVPASKCTRVNTDATKLCQNISSQELPSTINHSSYMSKIENQLNCNAGWAFAAIATVEGMYAKRGTRNLKLSEQVLIDCANGNTYGAKGCSGGGLWGPLMYLALRGTTSLRNYPYEGITADCKTFSNEVYQVNEVFRVATTEESLKTALTDGPIAIEIEIPPTLMHYSEGIFKHGNCLGVANHAVTLIGYGSESQDRAYWIIRNSWGPLWGEKGNYRLALEKPFQCGFGQEAFSVFIK